MQGQRALRERLFAHILRLDEELARAGDDFVFPDPHSLLLWLWTRYAFERTYVGAHDSRTRVFYRGEHRDYGPTRFRPSLSRSASRPGLGEPAALRARLWEHFRGLRVEGSDKTGTAKVDPLVGYLTDTMSCAQAVAVAQHYGVPTPLLDVTINPEVALYFATLGPPSDDGIGVVGIAELAPDDLAAESSLWANAALVVAPPAFTRIHLQSGFFLCMPDNNGAVAPFRVLRFRRPDARPFLPTWVAVERGPVASVDALLEDPLGVAGALRSLPNHNEVILPAEWPDPSALLRAATGALSDQLIQWTLDSVVGGAGRVGCTEDGRRYVSVDRAAYYILQRFGPVHGLIQTRVMEDLRNRYGASFTPVVSAMRGVMEDLMRAVLTDMAGGPVAIDDIFQIVTNIILGKVDDRPPWPISAWYSGA